MPTYARADLAFERGEGAYLQNRDGTWHLDFASGIAVTALGHSHPHLVAALTDQARKVWHTSNLYRIPDGERLARRLCEASFADSVFFCNSGVEAIEGAVKMVRKYHDETGHPGRHRVICCTDAFHGRTLTAIAASGSEKYRKGFEPTVEGFDHVAFNNTNELRQAITDDTGAILVEPVQGEGGIRPADLQYLRSLRRIADEYGLLLIFDEIQCGMGRSGKLFAHEWAEVAPDIMTLAKGIGGGFPLGAVLTTQAVADAMNPGSHGTTFGGNPLAMAVGNAVLDVMQGEGFLDGVDATARDLWHKLLALAERQPHAIEAVRGAGLMLGLKCVVPNGEMVAALRGERLLTVPAGDNVVRLLPPLIIGSAEVDEAVDKIERACESFKAEAAE